MLILILIDVQYLQNVNFSFENGLNGKNHSSSGSYQSIIKKILPQQKFPSLHWGDFPLPPFNTISKTLWKENPSCKITKPLIYLTVFLIWAKKYYLQRSGQFCDIPFRRLIVLLYDQIKGILNLKNQFFMQNTNLISFWSTQVLLDLLLKSCNIFSAENRKNWIQQKSNLFQWNFSCFYKYSCQNILLTVT